MRCAIATILKSSPQQQVGVPDQVASLAKSHLLNVLIWIEGFFCIFFRLVSN